MAPSSVAAHQGEAQFGCVSSEDDESGRTAVGEGPGHTEHVAVELDRVLYVGGRVVGAIRAKPTVLAVLIDLFAQSSGCEAVLAVVLGRSRPNPKGSRWVLETNYNRGESRPALPFQSVNYRGAAVFDELVSLESSPIVV